MSRDGSLALSCSIDGAVRLWDTTTGDCRRALSAERWSSVAMSGDGRLALLTSDCAVRLWDLDTGRFGRCTRRSTSADRPRSPPMAGVP